MSVRVCYVERGDRGVTLRALRLVGQASDDQWPEGGVESDDVDQGASWVKQRLAGTRSTSSLAMLCLDVEGGVCSWLTSPSTNPAIVAALARQSGRHEGDARGGNSAVDFYAADAFSSSVQALDGRPEQNGHHQARAGLGGRGQPAQEAQRLAVLAMGDVPGRLLMDALDRQGVPVELVASLWHAMAASWDPSAPRASVPGQEQALIGETASLTAVIIVDPQSRRLIWTWSRAGKLVVAGSMRVRQGAVETAALAQPGDNPAPMTVLYGPEEVSRLAAEWLTWAAQVGQAPSRFVCVLPDEGRTLAGEFGRALGKAWPGASVDVVTNEDPVGATLKRQANVLENTPLRSEGADVNGGLVALSQRPGSQHRRMYFWWAGAIAGAAVVLTVLGVQLRGRGEAARGAADTWKKQGLAAMGQAFPDVLTDRPGVNKYVAFKAEVDRARKAHEAPQRTEDAMPILEELETISLVVGNSGYAIESIELGAVPRFSVIANSVSDAENLLEAMKRVSGSHVIDWALNPSTKREGDVDKVRAQFSGRWVQANKPGSGV